VGVLRGITGGYTGMFVLLLAGVAGLGVSGWLATRQKYVDDEVPSWSPDRDDEGVPAGTEAPASAEVSRERDGSPSA
jgi:MFS transporter, CP family, cyanate transporter